MLRRRAKVQKYRVDYFSVSSYTWFIKGKEENKMSLGNRLFHARKKCGLSQEDVAEKLGVSRQTISKWETDETLPDIRQSKRMALLYKMSLDDLIDFDVDVKEIQEIIEKTDERTEEKIDWTEAWGKKYPILIRYQKQVDIQKYATQLELILDALKAEYEYNDLDTFLVLKDILAKLWGSRKK